MEISVPKAQFLTILEEQLEQIAKQVMNAIIETRAENTTTKQKNNQNANAHIDNIHHLTKNKAAI